MAHKSVVVRSFHTQRMPAKSKRPITVADTGKVKPKAAVAGSSGQGQQQAAACQVGGSSCATGGGKHNHHADSPPDEVPAEEGEDQEGQEEEEEEEEAEEEDQEEDEEEQPEPPTKKQRIAKSEFAKKNKDRCDNCLKWRMKDHCKNTVCALVSCHLSIVVAFFMLALQAPTPSTTTSISPVR